jgi:serine/threonine protein kinase/Tol biopolymer transport system component
MTLERGTLLHKRYRIVEILGQGGMGSVYRAVDENLGVDVAVKENLFTTDEYSRQFRLEAVILANLRHPNLPRVSDHFVVGDTGQYLVMDFIEGEDLRQRMERMGTITEDDAIMVGAAICEALSYLHSRKPPILHRDIKPGNVKITPDGHIFLVDFGLAKVVQGSQATTTGARAMTPGYSPPEQYGTARTDPRTDIYSLGATLYAALCGMIPEDGLARAMDNAQLTPLRKRNPKISRRLAAAIEKAMSIDPADRFQSPDDLKKALLNSKSKTQRITGEFTVEPPPDMPDAPPEDKKEKKSEPKSGKSGVPVPPPPIDDDKPFVPPKKRRRGNRAWIWLLFLLIVAAVVVAAFFPDVLPASLRAILPSNSPTATATLEPTATLPATMTPIVMTRTASPIPLTATFTQTPTLISPAGIDSATVTATVEQVATESPTPASTPVGGGVGEIAFASTRAGGAPQIILSDLNGDNIKPLTNLPVGACQPAWSPDGKQLVFVSPCDHNLDIAEKPPKDTALYVVNADGSNLTPIPTVPGGDFEPAWSPDGKRIAFTSMRDGHMQIYLYNFTDQSVTRLTNTSSDIDTREPSWSPFSNQIAYAEKRFGVYQIWTMTDTGEGQQQIVHSGQNYWDYLPIWSPDGKNILFSERNANTTGPAYTWLESIVYENRNTDQPSKLNLGTASIENVRYSPDGFWLAFESQGSDGNKDIYFMTLSGAQRTRLTKDPAVDFDPAWRPMAP